MSHDPTPTQALLIFGLLARHGDCAQAELMPAVKKADRETLVKAKLIGTGKVGRGLKLTLTDAGWAWAAAHLDAELPPAQRTLSDLLMRLEAHLAKRRETLAEFIGSKPTGGEPSASKAKTPSPQPKKSASSKTKPKSSGKASASKSKSAGKTKPVIKTKPTSKAKPASKVETPSPQAALRERIEAACLQITGGRRNESVRLARLRDALPDVDRATLDSALGQILAGDETASLMRQDDPNQIDEADRKAAFAPFGEPFHVIWIAS